MTTARHIQAVRVNRAAYSGLGSTIVAWIVVVQVTGWTAGQFFEYRVGFFPVWFLDCTACLPRGGWLPSDFPFFGGMSYWVVVASLASLVLAVGKRTGMRGTTFRWATTVAAVSMVGFTLIALDTRYPGSLPSVVVTVLPGAVAALAFSVAALVPGPAIAAAEDPSPMTLRSLIAVVLGPVSMMTLGGLISIVALYSATTGYARAPDSRNRRAAVGGLTTGLLSIVMRWNLSGRYEFLGIWI